MKVLGWLSVCIAVCAGASVSVPLDNSHYVEGVSRFIWMTDDSGSPQLVDLHEPVQHDSKRSGSNNQYLLFTRSNPSVPQILIPGNLNSVLNSNYNPNLPTKVLSHGWIGSGFSRSSMIVKDAYLDTGDYNIISICWRDGASGGYVSSAAIAPEVGQYAGRFLSWLINTVGGDWKNVHLIGFSLGGHVVGNAGRTADGIPQRVTGLDVAGPLWWNSPNAINTGDGEYVEGIHTDGRVTGIMQPIGHADFYPNGGRNPQPGCFLNTCSHDRAFELFASSVRTDHLVGRLCTSLEEAESNACNGRNFNMGNGILNKRGTGLYGMSTGSVFPF